MEIKNKISDWVMAHEDEMICDLTKLCAIRSVRSEAQDNMPYGEEVDKALKLALSMCAENGFIVENHGGYVGTASINDKENMLDILTHMDIVTEGAAHWDANPYELENYEGKLYARGTEDDKGPFIASLYALRCVKELGLDLKSNCRLIIGTDEESGMSDTKKFFETNTSAKYSFSPDGTFPVCNVEKGRFTPRFSMKWKAKDKATPRVTHFRGGECINIVPNEAEARVVGLSAATVLLSTMNMAQKYNIEILVTQEAEAVIINVRGKSAHASTPHEGVNAITGLLKVLMSLNLAECGSTFYIRELYKRFPHETYYGEGLGIAMEDEVSGKLTASLSLLTIDDEGIVGEADLRIPVCANENNCQRVIEKSFSQIRMKVDGNSMDAHYVDENSEFIQTLLSVFEDVTGEKGSCYFSGGATYAHHIEGAVCFGIVKNEEDCTAHMANECIKISDLLDATKIFTQAIIEICG